MKVFCCAIFFFVFSEAERTVAGVEVSGGSVTVLDSGITEAQPQLLQYIRRANPQTRRAALNYLNMMMRLHVSEAL